MVRPVTYGYSRLLGLVEEMTSGEFDPKVFLRAVTKGHTIGLGTYEAIEIISKWLAERIKCPKCKGRGMYSSIVKQIGSEGDKEVDAFCWDCDGSGKIQRIDSPEFRKVRNNE